MQQLEQLHQLRERKEIVETPLAGDLTAGFEKEDYINATKKIDRKTFLLGGREHLTKRRSVQTLFVVHAGVNHRERAQFPFCSAWQTTDFCSFLFFYVVFIISLKK
ncbi:hypothetical protein [Ectobacillus panaciterrae]|uniref:hypothetical protein n=1 Tax=Ectobacillus panaciterrae TaxID=363872 RepID=UPI00048F4CF9|nr:hypothetical protein [Ectobacillus panaciterrae]